MNVFQRIEELDLPAADFIVEGSGVLDALGIRKSRDLDVVVNESTFEQLQKRGFTRQNLGEIPYVEKGDIEAWLNFDGKNFDELMEEAVQIKGYNFSSLDLIISWKQRRGLDKDKKDLELIDKYLKENS